jgi:hypothetical protein
MAVNAFTRAVRGLDMNLETTNQPQQSTLRREAFFSLTVNLSLQWVMATGCVLCLWRKTERWQKSSSLLSQRFGARQALYQWPTDEPYSVIAFRELRLCETMLGKEHPSTLTSINNLVMLRIRASRLSPTLPVT